MQTLFITLALLASVPLLAQGTRADYDRAAALPRLTDNQVFKKSVNPHWLPGNTQFWYRNDLPGDRREFVLVDAEQGLRQPAFDHARLADALAKATGKKLSPERLPVDNLDLGPAKDTLCLAVESKWWLLDLHTYALQTTNRPQTAYLSLPRYAAPPPTKRTGAESSITFVNQTKGPVVTYWINRDKERQRFATLKPGVRFRQHTFAGHQWLVTDADGKTLGVFEAQEADGEAVIATEPQPSPPKTAKPAAAKNPLLSPNGQFLAVLKDYNLHLRQQSTGQTFPLSRDGSAEDAYTDQIAWSPDSSKLAAFKKKKGEERKVWLVESSPTNQLQPKLHSYDYNKPGDRIAVQRPRLFDVAAKKEIPVSTELCPNPWSLSELHWSLDSQQFTFLYNQRGHQVLRVVEVDAATGATRPLIDERSQTFICYSGKFFLHHLPATKEILWLSERDGWNHLYLYDAATGRVKNQVTRGPWVVRQIDRVEESARQIWFRAGGIRPGQDPYYVHFCRVNFDGTGLTVLTEADGQHSVQFSPDQRFLLDTWSRVDLPPVTELRRADQGKRLCELERADASALLKTGWCAPQRFSAKGRDGQTDIYGIIIRPSNFDPAKKYPVIEEIYAGPHGAFVPKSFGLLHRQYALAELGFIVVQIDGMGTSYRSKAFHDVCWKNLADSGFPDRIAWLKAAAARHPELDLSRVGIYGGSAGGQSSTRALLSHGDFYRVAVSDCGCHDNRMDKIWWNEQWLGWPIDESYARNSNVTDAPKLQGKLLLIVGELDHNVDPASTMQVANALIKADKDFELLVIPGAGHGSAESPYGVRRRMDFFVRHLWGAEPRRP